jgi:hypothetical protein
VVILDLCEEVKKLFFLFVSYCVTKLFIEICALGFKIDGSSNCLEIIVIAHSGLINFLEELRQNPFDFRFIHYKGQGLRPYPLLLSFDFKLLEASVVLKFIIANLLEHSFAKCVLCPLSIFQIKFPFFHFVVQGNI